VGAVGRAVMGVVGVISSHVVLGICAVVLFLLWGAAL
jgi:hypothetical protein